MLYSAQVLDHARNPRNVGYIEAADGRGTCGDPDCGDFAIITIKVQHDQIVLCKFLVRGCGAAIATCSAITEIARGKALWEAQQISDEDIVAALDGLPPEKLHCSNLAATALHEAIADYRSRRQTDLRDWRSLYQRV